MLARPQTPWAIILLLLNVCACKIVDHVGDLPGLDYDFIIVGGGTAGNVIANRLTENPKFSVLVLEAGPSNQNGDLNLRVPLFCLLATPNTPYDWNYTTTPQSALNGRSSSLARGHVLGGSSSVNFMGYTRGTSDDYDRYAKLSGDPGWSWNSVLPYFKKNERWTAPADRHNTAGQFNPAVHGFNGVNLVSLSGFSTPIDSRIIQTTRELPEFPFNLDHNSGNHLGIGWSQFTIGNGERSSSATSYLGSQNINRPNLQVLLHAQVAKVLPSKSKVQGKLAFQTVEFTDGVGGPTFRATAKKEVVLSAGSIGTPHILLNSGIGDSSELSPLGVKSLVDLPSVGKNLSDHPGTTHAWIVNSTNTFDNIWRNATYLEEQVELWKARKQGVLVDGPSNNIGWIRLPSNASIFQQVKDPSAGPNTGHFELVWTNGILFPGGPPTGGFMSALVSVMSPTSRGSITINSTNPFDPPLINPNWMTTTFDLFAMREAIRAIRRFHTAPAWNGYIISYLNNATTDAELDDFIRGNAAGISHPVGTAGMSPKGAKYGVVDPDLRVKGVVGLRIVDASVIPIVPAAHTQAATYVFAERGADLIKSAWR